MIIPADRKANFKERCHALLVETPDKGGPTHKEKIDELHRLFPKAQRWLDWWTMSNIQAMLFPSRRPKLEDSPGNSDLLPRTMNVVESFHCVYHMIRYVIS
jgi:hypothetical protein